MASLTIRGTVLGIELSVPLFRVPALEAVPAAPSSATVLTHSRQPSPAVPAPSAEVAELQRRLIASRDQDVASLMTNNPDQLDPLNAASIARWLQAKGCNLDVAEEHIHVHAHWRQSFMPAGHIPEVLSQTGFSVGLLSHHTCWYAYFAGLQLLVMTMGECFHSTGCVPDRLQCF